ncbi:MAG: hydrogenase maturation protease [Candidatus Omnitrophica bacterium]|nr:hydrogenase maturation protease [Candidatus Omnitrophota bacterium]
MKRSPLFIGVGNRFRRDDGVGLWLAREIKRRGPRTAEVLETDGEGAGLMEAWKDRGEVFLFDAVRSGAPAGTLHRVEVSKQPLARNFFRGSTHDFGVAEAVELSRSLRGLPGRLLIFGVEGKDFGEGEGLSPPVETAARNLLSELLFRGEKT